MDKSLIHRWMWVTKLNQCIYFSSHHCFSRCNFATDMRLWKRCTRLWLSTYTSESLYVIVFIYLTFCVKIDVVNHQAIEIPCHYHPYDIGNPLKDSKLLRTHNKSKNFLEEGGIQPHLNSASRDKLVCASKRFDDQVTFLKVILNQYLSLTRPSLNPEISICWIVCDGIKICIVHYNYITKIWLNYIFITHQFIMYI